MVPCVPSPLRLGLALFISVLSAPVLAHRRSYKMDVRMDGWINGWTDEWMVGQMDRVNSFKQVPADFNTWKLGL